MTRAGERGVPVRDDRWRPADELLDSVIAKCIGQARREAPESGGSPVLVAGAMVLAVLAAVLALGTGDPELAFAVVALLAVAGIAYVGLKAAPTTMDRTRILSVIGGAGNLPAGYLVHPLAWEAGMREHLAGVPDRHLRVATQLCRAHPGSVSDLVRLVQRAENRAAHQLSGHDVSEAELRTAAAHMIMEAVGR